MKNWVYGLINWSYVCLQLLGFFPKLTLIFHVSWYVSLSPGIARQLQTTPVVFPFLYLNRGDAFRCWLFGACIPCLIARAGYQISCPQISYPEKDTIQSWTVGTFLEKKKTKQMLLVWQPQSSPERVFSFCDVFSYLALEKLQNNWIYLPQINVLCPVRVVHSHTQLLRTKDSAWFECAWGRLLESLTVVLQQTSKIPGEQALQKKWLHRKYSLGNRSE